MTSYARDYLFMLGFNMFFIHSCLSIYHTILNYDN